MNKDFRNYAVHHLGMNGLALDQYASAAAQQITSSYISPTIIGGASAQCGAEWMYSPA